MTLEFVDLMAKFGEKIGLPDLRPEDDSCYVEIDGMPVSFMEHGNSKSLVTWADVCDVPPGDGAGLSRILMEAMYMGRETDGSTFSIESGSGKIVLHRIDPLVTLDLDAFCAMLEKFVNVLEKWRDFIAGYHEDARNDDNGTSGDSSSFGGGFIQV